MAVDANHNHDKALLNGAVEKDHTNAVRALRGSGAGRPVTTRSTAASKERQQPLDDAQMHGGTIKINERNGRRRTVYGSHLDTSRFAPCYWVDKVSGVFVRSSLHIS